MAFTVAGTDSQFCVRFWFSNHCLDVYKRQDKIRDTATSHDRLFFVEVMGRDAGFLALNGAIASGAEAAIIPEISLEKDQLAEMIENGFRKSKNSSIVLVAESEVTLSLIHIL